MDKDLKSDSYQTGGSSKNAEFNHENLQDAWTTLNGDHTHEFKDQVIDGPICRGRTNFEEMSKGLFLSNSDVVFLRDMTIDVTREPCFMLAVLLEGDMHMRLQNRDLTTRAVKQVAVAFSEKVTTESDVEANHRIKLTGLVAKQDWLIENNFDHLLKPNGAIPETVRIGGTCVVERDVPGPLLSIAERLMDISEVQDPLPRLRREALALEYFAESVGNLTQAADAEYDRRLTRQEWIRIRDVRNHVQNAPLEDDLSLASIAKSSGMSISTLNRHFRIAFDTTVIAFLTECRMHAAWKALTEDGFSVVQAAHLAGFSNPANFSTAFRKRYGVTPKTARKQVFPTR